MIINHNMNAMNAHRFMSGNTATAGKSMEKLSSGLRINRAGDDAAGLAISEKMRAQIRGLDQASKNSQDGISMIQTAEGALSETQSILQRMRELATQSANSTNVSVDREEIQKEMNQLSSEVNRIGNTTEFNTQKVLNGGSVNKTIDINTVTAGAAKGEVSGRTETLKSTSAEAAVFKTGDLTKLTSGETASFSFNGTTININTVASGTTTTYSNVTKNSIDITLEEGSAQVADLITALGKMAAFSGSPLDSSHFTIAASGATSITFTGVKTDGATNNAQLISFKDGSGNDQLTNIANASQLSHAGVTEVRGQVSFSIDKPFNSGDTIQFGGVTFTGKTATAAGLAAGEFDISSANPEEQAKSLANAMIQKNDAGIAQRYDISVSGNKITFTEKATKAAGSANIDFGTITTTATQGKYNINIDSSNMAVAGGKYSIDDVNIRVTTDTTDAGLQDGTAMLVGKDNYEQGENLVNAIKLNSTLSAKYDVAVGSPTNKITLTQKSGYESRTGTTASTNTQSTDGFVAKLQIGANTNQSFEINVSDMRSEALKVTGTVADGTVVAKNGATAAYTKVSNVTNGTDSNNVEYALDVSTHEKATAAISVINDAIESVSAQRSQLGAYQNRLEHTIANLGTSSENLTSAESRIRDVDMAKEMMTFSKNNILSQAAQAMLAQANQQPQGVLQLLR